VLPVAVVLRSESAAWNASPLLLAKGDETMFPPVFPIYLPFLVPLHEHATLIWLGGVVCLWLTRYTHQLGQRWGPLYYRLSMVVRPAGILLIAVGWLALWAPDDYMRTESWGWMPHRSAVDVLCWAAIGGFTLLGAWSVLILGVRRSFLYRHFDDRLVTRGPYALVRHPQFLSAIGIAFFTIRLFDPRLMDWWNYDAPMLTSSLDANWALFTLALWVLSILEERELQVHFGRAYTAYARRVPRLFPN
jgi:protein-S-isoprenylcysteine O-methyltransferase Ste14